MDSLTIISLVWVGSEIMLSRLMHSSATGSRSDRLSLRVLWATITLSIIAGVLIAMSGWASVAPGNHVAVFSGLVLIVAGLALRWTAILTLRRYFTVDVHIMADHKIISSGLYRFIRHPAYSGSLLSFLGLAVSFSNWLAALVIFVPITAAFLYRINVEEEALAAFFGDEYTNYCTTTYRLIPGVY